MPSALLASGYSREEKLTLNAASPHVSVLALGIIKRPESEDLRDVGGDYIKNMCDRYIGTGPLNVMNT